MTFGKGADRVATGVKGEVLEANQTGRRERVRVGPGPGRDVTWSTLASASDVRRRIQAQKLFPRAEASACTGSTVYGIYHSHNTI